jgi:uncharacterized RDD family membrane protein YckC
VSVYCPKCGAETQNGSIYCRSCGHLLGQEPTGGGPSGAVAYAGFWRRFVAYIVDGIILNVFMGIVSYVAGIGPRVVYTGDLARVATGRGVAYGIISLVVIWLYFTLLESTATQATLGKMAMGIVVTDLKGGRISFGRANARFWSKFLSSAILLIGYVMAGFTEKKQALHDLLAETLVIQKPTS